MAVEVDSGIEEILYRVGILQVDGHGTLCRRPDRSSRERYAVFVAQRGSKDCDACANVGDQLRSLLEELPCRRNLFAPKYPLARKLKHGRTAEVRSAATPAATKNQPLKSHKNHPLDFPKKQTVTDVESGSK